MAKQLINIGKTVNDRSGDPLRVAFDKANQNFTELYALTAGSGADFTEVVQDAAASLFTTGNHDGIAVSYNDADNKLNLTVNIDGGDASSTF